MSENSNRSTPAPAGNGDASKPSGLRNLLQRRWIKTVLVIAVLLAAVAVGLFFYANRPVTVQVASLHENVPVRVFGLGTVEARVLSKIGFEVGATIIELKVDHGDRVSKGDVVARLSSGAQEAKVAKARAALRIAEVNIERAKANVEKARSVHAQKELANRRTQDLKGRDIVSDQAAEEAARDEAVAKADIDVAVSDLAAAKAQLVDAKAQLSFEETMLRHRTLVAPFDALVIARHKELGAVINAGEPIYTLVAPDTIWGLAHVDEARAGFIRKGQHVDARLRSRPQNAFTGRVARIGLESDRVTEERRVYVKGDNPPPRVFLGEQAEFWITVAHLDKALLVPEAAVTGYDGREGWVWTVEDGRLKRRRVAFRHRTEEAMLEIVSGVPDRTRVVSRIGNGFREGRRARFSRADDK